MLEANGFVGQILFRFDLVEGLGAYLFLKVGEGR